MEQTERNRLEEFRQLRKEIRHSEDYLVVGIDIAKEHHHAFFGTATGKTLLRRLVFSNDGEGFRKLLDQAEVLRVRHGLKKVVYGMEPTGNYHKPLGEYLIHLGRRVVLVSGVTAKHNRESLDGRWDKHDDKDSANVADLISQGKCLYYEYPSAQLRGLRGLLSLKRRLKRQEQSYRVRIRNHLIAEYFPEMDRDYERLEDENVKGDVDAFGALSTRTFSFLLLFPSLRKKGNIGVNATCLSYPLFSPNENSPVLILWLNWPILKPCLRIITCWFSELSEKEHGTSNVSRKNKKGPRSLSSNRLTRAPSCSASCDPVLPSRLQRSYYIHPPKHLKSEAHH